jgi:hypothetical protein
MTPIAALQAALAGEHAAVYVYGVLGGQASQSKQPKLYTAIDTAYLEHRRRRDALTRRIADRGVDPAPSAASYRLPNAAANARQLRIAARVIERRCTTVYGQLVESTSGSDRQWAIAALRACALRELAFGAQPSDFPGLSS